MDISKIPNEILIEIFEFCKVLRLTEVSKKFNDIISNSPLLMSKIQLLITQKTKANEITKSQRRYQNILIRFNYRIEDEVMEIIGRFGSDIKHLEMTRCMLYDKVFHQILKSIPNVQTISIVTTFLKSNFDEEFDMPDLKKLRKFTFRNSEPNFLNFVKNSKSLKCMNVTFVHHQPIEIMKNFLEEHPEIEDIENIMVESIDDKLMTQIVNLKHLKRLSLEVVKIDMAAIRDLEHENVSVVSLNLFGNAENSENLNSLLKIFKGLKSLEIEMNSTLEVVNMTQLNTTQIHTLNFNQCQGDFFNAIQINSLRNFQINEALSITQQDWIQFAHRNPNIEVLKIKDESISNETFVAITQNFRNLKHFELFFDPQRLTREILNFICDNFPTNIKVLKISERISSNVTHFNLTDEQREKLKHKHGFKMFLN